MNSEIFVKTLNFDPCSIYIRYSIKPQFRIQSIKIISNLDNTEKVDMPTGESKDSNFPETITNAFNRYFIENKPLDIPIELLDLSNVPDFYKKVLQTLTGKIIHGKVTTYANLAKLCSNPKASRAAGTAMATNPFPLIIPCHRVLKSDLTVGNYGPGPNLKLFLLKKEIGSKSFSGFSLIDKSSLI